MTLYYIAGFESSFGGVTLRFQCHYAGAVATVADGTYAHESMINALGAGKYVAFAAAVQAAFVAAAGGSPTVTWNPSTLNYTISRPTNFTLAFTAVTDDNMAHALGFAAGSTQSGQNTYTSTVRPYYVIQPTELARSASLPYVYEPGDIVTEAISDGGTPYGVARKTNEQWSDWQQTMEAKAAVYDLLATAAVPWTWQKFFKHVRGQRPFTVVESAFGHTLCYRLRKDGASFKPIPVGTLDWDGLFNIQIHARMVGDNT